jgi:hypothetical protein
VSISGVLSASGGLRPSERGHSKWTHQEPALHGLHDPVDVHEDGEGLEAEVGEEERLPELPHVVADVQRHHCHHLITTTTTGSVSIHIVATSVILIVSRSTSSALGIILEGVTITCLGPWRTYRVVVWGEGVHFGDHRSEAHRQPQASVDVRLLQQPAKEMAPWSW